MLTRKTASGFTLVEIAIVLAIVALLMAGLLPTISGQVERQHVSETRKQLDEIQQALIGYAVINGRLPCPADGTIATGQSGAGVEVSSCTSSSAAGGVLPWVTLGVSETDSWGRRFSYRVDPNFADAISANTLGSGCSVTPPTQSSFALCSPGTLNVLSAASGGSNIATSVPAVVVSHGSDGYGAYNTSGQQIAGASGDEGENADNDNTFVSHDFTPTFDDLVIWISPNILLNRMVTAGKLP
ncbi:MAG: prepilin-type N-terminal cleavage/methylation domain-containing protein [Sideroxydans sp.]|nr:prepilin-type N-terminal cleavage/methylation domain-containing protein [Sideroxydans sp.]